MAYKESSSDRTQNARTDSPFLTTAQAGSYVGLSRRTLEKMRTTGNGPAYRKHGRYVRYHMADLDAWSEARRKTSTAEQIEQALKPAKRTPSEKGASRSGRPTAPSRKALKGDRSDA
jgi:excisionase family DNA binding protein